jgi:hypothetical protein
MNERTDQTTTSDSRAVWARKWRSFMFGRTDALAAGWRVFDRLVRWALKDTSPGDGVLRVSLVRNRRMYSLFWGRPIKENANDAAGRNDGLV